MDTIIGEDIRDAIKFLKLGEVIGIPTETVYGLAGDACDISAIKKIYSAKNRPNTNPLILHFASVQQIQPFVEDFPENLLKLTQKFWPGPLTILLKKSNLVPNEITANQDLVAVRIPNHVLLLSILSQLDFPLAAPSANTYGMVSPTSAKHVMQDLKGKIPFILDGGTCKNGLESTIVGLQEQKVVVYRLGAISLEELETELGYVPTIIKNIDKKPLTSGMDKHHYAPKTPLHFYEKKLVNEATQNTGFIFFQDEHPEISEKNKIILSKSGSLDEAANKLYASLIEMDTRNFNAIYIERLLDEGLGKTMNDRLNRATLKFRK